MWNYTRKIDFRSLADSDKPSLIFKHSNRCSISDVALRRVLKFKEDLEHKFNVYLIDVVADRPLSLGVASELNVQHESPQAIVVSNGQVIHSASHLSINANKILNSI